MTLQFVSYDNLDILKSNLTYWVDKFRQDSAASLEAEFENKLFANTKYTDVPAFSLDMSSDKSFSTDAVNVERVYGSLRFLSDSQASDERLWAGLCLGEYWDYVKYRWGIDKECTEAKIRQHFLFGYGPRRSLTRNALSRLWWIGRFTYDDTRSDPWELTRFVCENADYIMHILERNTSNNPIITNVILSALLDARREGLQINTNTVGELAKYLNLLGGIYILDCLSTEFLYKKLYAKIIEMR